MIHCSGVRNYPKKNDTNDFLNSTPAMLHWAQDFERGANNMPMHSTPRLKSRDLKFLNKCKIPIAQNDTSAGEKACCTVA